MSEKTVKRWSTKRKQEVVLHLLRDEFLEGGIAALQRRTDDPRSWPWSRSSNAPSGWLVT